MPAVPRVEKFSFLIWEIVRGSLSRPLHTYLQQHPLDQHLLHHPSLGDTCNHCAKCRRHDHALEIDKGQVEYRR